MRLFIAIEFNGKVKDSIYATVQDLKGYAARGNFTMRENLHLTIVFIGETTKTNEIKLGMDKVNVGQFQLSIRGLGKFPKGNKDIYWLGVEKNNTLSILYNQLYKELQENGLQLESREFKPHLTLGREIVLNDSFDERSFGKTIPAMDMEVTKISLMKSERVNGKLTYTAIYEKSLLGITTEFL